VSEQAPKLGCLATFMLAAFIAVPLAAVGVPGPWAFGAALLVVLIGMPTIYAVAAGRRREREALATPPMQNPPAGWYPDPTGKHGVRYWTGVAWSDRVADRPR
jgi:hypothetical protein